MPTWTLGLLLLWSLSALAQQPAPFDLNSLPRDGQDPKAFVPQGWKVQDTLKADLNKDNSLDVVLQLVQDGPDQNAQGESNEHQRMLVVLLEAGGKLHRVGASTRIIYCTTCAGMFNITGPGQVKIDKGVIIVDQIRGSREMVHTTLRLRYEPKDKRVLLIGEDVSTADRGAGGANSVSTNLLTGQRITEKSRFDEKKNDNVTLSSKKDKVPVKKLYLEDVDISKY